MNEFDMQVLDDEGKVFAERRETALFIQKVIDRCGIDHVLLRLCGDKCSSFIHPSLFGFHQTRVKKNGAIARRRLQETFRINRKARLGLDFGSMPSAE